MTKDVSLSLVLSRPGNKNLETNCIDDLGEGKAVYVAIWFDAPWMWVKATLVSGVKLGAKLQASAKLLIPNGCASSDKRWLL